MAGKKSMATVNFTLWIYKKGLSWKITWVLLQSELIIYAAAIVAPIG